MPQKLTLAAGEFEEVAAPRSSSPSLPFDPYQRVKERAPQFGVDPELAAKIMTRESGGKQYKNGRVLTSESNARGLMQVLPETGRARGYNVDDPYENIDAGLAYLSEGTKRYKGDPALVAGGYFAGYGNIEKAVKNPKGNPKTHAYMRGVAGDEAYNAAVNRYNASGDRKAKQTITLRPDQFDEIGGGQSVTPTPSQAPPKNEAETMVREMAANQPPTTNRPSPANTLGNATRTVTSNPTLELDLSDYIKRGAVPTHQELAKLIYANKALGFTDEEAAEYAKDSGRDIAYSFYDAKDPDAAATSIFERAAGNDRGLAAITGLTPTALEEKRKWLQGYRDNKRLEGYANLTPQQKMVEAYKIAVERPLTDKERVVLDANNEWGKSDRLESDIISALQGAGGSMLTGAGVLEQSLFPGLSKGMEKVGLGDYSPSELAKMGGGALSDMAKITRNLRGGQDVADDIVSTTAGAVPYVVGGFYGAPVTAAMGGFQNAGDLYREARESGADEGKARTAGVLGAPIGAMEGLLGLGKLGGRVAEQEVKGLLIPILREMGEEATQEAAQQVLNNLVAKGIYDRERGVFKNVGYNALLGGITGGLLGGGTHALGKAVGGINARSESVSNEQGTQSAPVQDAGSQVAAMGNVENAPIVRTANAAAPQTPPLDSPAATPVKTQPMVEGQGGRQQITSHDDLMSRLGKESPESIDAYLAARNADPTYKQVDEASLADKATDAELQAAEVEFANRYFGQGQESQVITPEPQSYAGQERRVREGTAPEGVGERRVGINLLDAPQGRPAPAGVKRIISERNKAQGERRNTERELEYDKLTGLPNQRALDKALPAADADPETSVIFSDMNNAKAANDILGHDEADRFYKRQAEALRQAAKEYGSGQVFRRTGDEMPILRVKNDVAEKVALRAEELFGEETLPNGVKISLTAAHGKTLKDADLAVNARKDSRREAYRKIEGEEKPYHHSQDQPRDESTKRFTKAETSRHESIPETLYHGTGKDFDTFDLNQAGSNLDVGFLGKGVYLTEGQEAASYYSTAGTNVTGKPRVLITEANITNPFQWGKKTQGARGLVMRNEKLPAEIHDEVIKRTGFKFDPEMNSENAYKAEKAISQAITDILTEKGYDGVVAETSKGKEVVAFQPEQVKFKYEKGRPTNEPTTQKPSVAPSPAGKTGGRGTGGDGVGQSGKQGERSFPKTLEEYDLAGGNDRIYRVVGNRESVKTARDNIAFKGVDGAAEFVRNSKDPSAEVTATGIAVIDEYQRQALAESDPTKKAELYQKANDVASDLSAKLTRAGQAIQAAKLVEEFGTTQAVLSAEGIAKKRGRKLTPQQTEEITKAAVKLEEATKRVRELESIVADYESRKQSKETKRRETVAKSLDAAAVAARERLATLTNKPATEPAVRTDPAERGAISFGGNRVSDQTVADLAAVQAAKVHAGDKTLAEIRKEMSTEFGADYDSTYRRVERQADAILKAANRQESVLPKGRTKTPRAELGKAARESSKWDAGIREAAENAPDDMIAQATVKLADNIAAKAGRRAWQKEMEAAYGKDYTRHADSIFLQASERIKAAKKAHTEYGEILRAHREGAVTEEQIATIKKRLADERERHRNANLDLAQHYDRLAGGRWWNIISGVRKAGLLSSVRTHLRNVISNTAYQTFDEVSRIPAVVTDFAISGFTKQRSITGASPAASLDAVLTGFKVGGREAMDILKHGVTQEQAAKLQLPEELNSGIKVIDTAANTIFRAMAAGDRVFYQGATKRNLLDRAKVQALNEVREGKIKHRDVASRTREIVKSPPDEMLANAKHDALVATFNNSNKLSDAIRRARSTFSAPANFAIDLVMPFDRTPTNVVMRTLEASPLGYGKAAKIAAKSIINKAMTVEEQRQFSQTMGRATTGTAIMALGFILGSKGLMSAFYDEDEDYQSKKENRRLKEQGKSPMAIKIGNQWVTIGDTNIGNMLAIGATLQKEMAEAGGDRMKQFTGTLKTGRNVFLEQPLLSSAKDIVKAGSDIEGKGADYAGRLLSSFIPGAGMVRDMAGAMDDKARKTFGLKGQIYSSIPGLRNQLPEDVGVQHRRSWAFDPFRMKTDMGGSGTYTRSGGASKH